MVSHPAASRARFSLKSRQNDASISVSSYRAGQQTTKEIEVKKDGNSPVLAASEDEQRAAQPLNLNVFSQLTPTLHKFTLPNKVAVITGYASPNILIGLLADTSLSAGRGLGLNMAQGLAEVGVRGLAILDVQQEIGDKAARELAEQTGVDARFYRVDVRDGQAVFHTVQDIVDHYGEVNVLINAAGIAE